MSVACLVAPGVVEGRTPIPMSHERLQPRRFRGPEV
jgi:hypothetical protein